MQYGECNWRQAGDLTDKVVVLPLGSVEQHGHHLPLLTDSMIGAEIVRRAEEVLGDSALFLPMLWIGASDHHLGFPGTVSVSCDTYTRMLSEMLESLIGSGFRRIFVLNAHGGNVVAGELALYEVQMRHRTDSDLWLVLGTWFLLTAPQIASLEVLDQKRVSHAAEPETSMILRLRADLVDLEQARGGDSVNSSPFCRSVPGGIGRVRVWRPFEQRSVTGALGHPELATPEKGEALFETVVAEVVACVRDIATWPEWEPR